VDLRRESDSIKNWKRIYARVQIVRAFSFKKKDNSEVVHADQEEPNSQIIAKEKPWWTNGSLIIYPENRSILIWNFFKSLVVAASFFTFIF